jgi:acyl-CoA synthetase (AMP-forming)/AMP-acid ligase II
MQNNIGLFITKRAALAPHSEALVDIASGQRFTYAELNARCNRVANGLVATGVDRGDRVATLLMNGCEFVEVFFGAAKVGGVIVALNWRLVADELAFILADSGAETLVFGSVFDKVVAELQSRGSEATRVQNWIYVGDPAECPDFASGYEDFLKGASAEEPEIRAVDDDLLFIMYTSGTTGLPKGVMHSHETTLWASLTGLVTADMRWGDRYLLCLPLFHVGALNPLITTVHRGGTAVVMAQFDPQKIWQIYEEERITVTLAVPAMLNFMLQTYDADARDLSNLRWIMSGAAPLPVALIQKYAAMGIAVNQVYGLTKSDGGCWRIAADGD